MAPGKSWPICHPNLAADPSFFGPQAKRILTVLSGPFSLPPVAFLVSTQAGMTPYRAPTATKPPTKSETSTKIQMPPRCCTRHPSTHLWSLHRSNAPLSPPSSKPSASHPRQSQPTFPAKRVYSPLVNPTFLIAQDASHATSPA